MHSDEWSCPLSISDYPYITLAHGGGGRLTHELIDKLIYKAFDNALLQTGHDGAVFSTALAASNRALDLPQRDRLAFTTDSYVVSPCSFPGGDIGSLAVNGTVNDLAMCGAMPLYLSLSLILEEGLEVEELWNILKSIAVAAKAVNTSIVTGDTKVVERGKADKLFINTSGIGILDHPFDICPQSITPGDAIVISGDIGRHGIAIISKREGIQFDTEIKSDCAPLCAEVKALLDSGFAIHCLRDLTRGGLASALVELAEKSVLRIVVDETCISTIPQVRGACEMLGFDPLYVANEGRFLAVVPADAACGVRDILKGFNPSAAIIGEVTDIRKGSVVMKSVLGTNRVIDMFSGEQLPRIC